MTDPVLDHPALVAGRTAVITGAASGIGFAAAGALVARGMGVVMIDLPGAALEEAAGLLADKGGTVWAQGADVSDLSALEMIAAATAELPPVTFLMNNAGTAMPTSTLSGAKAWGRTLGVNLYGVIHGTMAFAPRMIDHGEQAVIVNTGSKQGITTPPGNPAYNVSKAGVKSYTEALAHELRNMPGTSVSAHLMIPGWVHTSMTAARGTPKPAGAWTPEEAVAFMLERLAAQDFYILCPDHDTPRALDEKRIAWAAGDLIENRPALSRWHPEWVEAFAAHLKG
jgi:NAD(P)-dependent dehydrogenase (short-subunit alcohol dehydrogenase family)